MSDITALPGALPAASAAQSARAADVSPSAARSNKSDGQGRNIPKYALRTAVHDLNQAGIAGQGREVTFSVDPTSRTSVVKVIDSQTREVIVQWPAEYALQLAEESRKTQSRHDETLLRTTHH